jgi:uncharacterized protein
MGLFGRRDGASRPAAQRLYYASDIHGSEILWRKFLNAAEAYDAPTLVMGGDVTGKVVIPFVAREDGVHVELFDQRHVLVGADVAEMADRVRANGMYPHDMDVAELDRVSALGEQEKEAWFAEVMRDTFGGWLALAADRLGEGTRCFVMPGNDDPDGVDTAIEAATKVEACDGRVVKLPGGYEMLSLGYANVTPFDSPRELPEDALYARIAALAGEVEAPERCIFNLHVPPYDSSLDTAPQLTDDLEVVMSGSAPKLIPVGSTAVRQAIEELQPLLSLHGHVHESPGATRIGRTLAINPGSDYHTGRINGCLIQLRGDAATHQFVTG